MQIFINIQQHDHVILRIQNIQEVVQPILRSQGLHMVVNKLTQHQLCLGVKVLILKFSYTNTL